MTILDARKAVYPALIGAAAAVTLLSMAGIMRILGSPTGGVESHRGPPAAPYRVVAPTQDDSGAVTPDGRVAHGERRSAVAGCLRDPPRHTSHSGD